MKKFSKNVNAERRKLVQDYVKERYSLESLLLDLGVWDGGTPVIKCPFHPDSRPSFNINTADNYYRCFSCNSYGGYLSFYHNYHSIVKEDEKSFNQHVEDILTADLDMQEALGFSTIFIKIENLAKIEDLTHYKRPDFNLVFIDTRNLEQIRRNVIKEGIDILLDFYSDIERGKSLDELWNKYVNHITIDDVLISKEEQESIGEEFRNLLADTFGEDDDGFTDLFSEQE